MEIFSALLALCAGNSPEFIPPQKPATRSFDLFFYLRLDKDWINNRGAGDSRRYRAHYDVAVMLILFLTSDDGLAPVRRQAIICSSDG